MRKQLINALFTLMLSASADAQTRELTDSGAFIVNAAGRYVRLEGHDGVVVDYLYDTADPEVTETSGVAVHPNDKVTLTVRYDRHGGVAVAGLPAITSLVDHEERTTAVQADGKSVAVLDYAPSGLFAAVTLPARLTWKVSAPDSSGRVRQSVENASGRIVASFVIADVRGVRPGARYDMAAAEFGVVIDTLTYEHSPTGSLITAHDAKGRVAFYVVHTDRCDVGFSPDGTPRFYDLELSVFGGTIAPGSDIMVSPATEAQGAAVPDHLVLTAGGAAGLYIEDAAKKSIVTAWADRDGKVWTARTEAEPVCNAPPVSAMPLGFGNYCVASSRRLERSRDLWTNARTTTLVAPTR
jgi:hypothetical protein